MDVISVLYLDKSMSLFTPVITVGSKNVIPRLCLLPPVSTLAPLNQKGIFVSASSMIKLCNGMSYRNSYLGYSTHYLENLEFLSFNIKAVKNKVPFKYMHILF